MFDGNADANFDLDLDLDAKCERSFTCCYYFSQNVFSTVEPLFYGQLGLRFVATQKNSPHTGLQRAPSFNEQKTFGTFVYS